MPGAAGGGWLQEQPGYPHTGACYPAAMTLLCLQHTLGVTNLNLFLYLRSPEFKLLLHGE